MSNLLKWNNKVQRGSPIHRLSERSRNTCKILFSVYPTWAVTQQHKFVHLYKIRYEQFFHWARGYKTQSYWEKKSIPLLLWAILKKKKKRKKKVIYPLTLWSQRECLRVCSNYIVIFPVRFKAKESSRKLLRVLEVLVLADEEFVKEISLGRFYGYSSRKATRVL